MNNSKNKFSKSYILIPLALFCCLLWGSAFPSVKIGYSLFGIAAEDSFSQIFFAGIRFTLAGILVILFGSLSSKKLLLPNNKNQFFHIAVLSVFQTILQYVAFYMGLAHTTGVKSSILVAVNVFFSLVISAVVFKMEKLTIFKAAGTLLGFAGVVIINISASGFSGGFTMKGEGAMVLSALAYAVSSVFIKKFSETDNPVMLSGWQFFFGGLFMMLFGKAFGASIEINSSNVFKAAAILLYLAFISAAAYTVWGVLLKHNPVSRVSVIGFMNPVFGVLLSAAFLGETAEAFRLKNLFALLLVCFGIFFVNYSFGVSDSSCNTKYNKRSKYY